MCALVQQVENQRAVRLESGFHCRAVPQLHSCYRARTAKEFPKGTKCLSGWLSRDRRSEDFHQKTATDRMPRQTRPHIPTGQPGQAGTARRIPYGRTTSNESRRNVCVGVMWSLVLTPSTIFVRNVMVISQPLMISDLD
jgi:hypothetical protein